MKRAYKINYTQEDDYICEMGICMIEWMYGCMRND